MEGGALYAKTRDASVSPKSSAVQELSKTNEKLAEGVKKVRTNTSPLPKVKNSAYENMFMHLVPGGYISSRLTVLKRAKIVYILVL